MNFRTLKALWDKGLRPCGSLAEVGFWPVRKWVSKLLFLLGLTLRKSAEVHWGVSLERPPHFWGVGVPSVDPLTIIETADIV